MSYQKLADSTKKIIGENANNYSKANYRQITLKLRPEVVEKFERMCEEAKVSRAEMFRRLINTSSSKE
ncbi:MAG: ribbon-helix-helix domain-containing protein [Aggregatibacter sp.]|uniref:ribbon-helix-helix domain-containing protein n=1 Tax=Aggregatibacter sp. TaxID=1872413 RepID=UPI00361F24B4